MATWDDVQVDFGGDETVNFGPRQEFGSQLYQVDTNAVINAGGKVRVNDMGDETSCVIYYYYYTRFI